MTTGISKPDRLASSALICGWLVPASLLLLPLFTFTLANTFWMFVSAGSVVASVLLARAAEASSRTVRVMRRLPPPAQCRRAVYVFSLTTIVGSLAILFDQQGTLGSLEVSNLQERYIEIAVATGQGDRLGTTLSTVGNLLRTVIYIAVAALVVYSKQVRGVRRLAGPTTVLGVALIVSEIATASRTYLVFCVVLAITAGFAVRHRLIRRIGTLIALALLAVVLFAITTTQRLEAREVDIGGAAEYLIGFFEVQLLPLGELAVNWLGAPVVLGLLYVSHALPEFSYLVANDSTTVALGSHSLYLVLAPLMRLVGMAPLEESTVLAERGGMWWGMLGDLYLDFGIGFLVAYPLLIVLMIRLTLRLGCGNVFTFAFRCLTATMLFCSPFFGVLNSYSFTYLMLLGLAVINMSMLRRDNSRAVH